jgi:hypothetical protein
VDADQLPRADTVSRKLLEELFERNERLSLDNAGKVHLLLTVAPMPRLGKIYPVVFESILKEKISTNPVKVGRE